MVARFRLHSNMLHFNTVIRATTLIATQARNPSYTR